jgi:hypothetical protein
MTRIEQIKTILFYIILPIAFICFFFVFKATYHTGFAMCGKGNATNRSIGFLKNQGELVAFNLDRKCPPTDFGGPVASLSIFFAVKAVATLEGEGTIRAYVTKNGVLCGEKIVSGKGRLTAIAICR